MFCPKCGQELKDEALFCYRCGFNLNEHLDDSSSEQAELPAEKELARIEAKRASVRDAEERSRKDRQRDSKKATKKSKKTLRIVTIICAVVVALAIAAAAVYVVNPDFFRFGGGSNVSFTSLSTQKTSTPDDLKSLVVKITNTSGDSKITGTGFFTADGCLVTGSNVVDTPGVITVTYADGTEDSATLVSNDIYTNTAILKVNDPKVKALNTSSSPAEGADNYYVVGFPESMTEPELIPVPVKKSMTSNGETISIEQSLDSGLIGSPVVDGSGNMMGVVTLANQRLNFALAGQPSDLEKNTKTLKDDQVITLSDQTTRVNQYTKAATEIYDVSEDELYVEGIYIYGSFTTETNVELSVHQKNSGLMKLYYNATGDLGMSFHSMGKASIVTVVTDQGEYTCQMNDTKIQAGDKGAIILKFDNYSGIAKEMIISPVLATPYSDAPSSISIRLDIYQNNSPSSSDTDSSARSDINAAFLSFLENMESYDEDIEKNYVSIEYGDGQMPPMIFYHTFDDGMTGGNSIHMAIYDQNKVTEITGADQFLNDLDYSDAAFFMSSYNGAASEDIHTEFLKLKGDSSLYVYYRDYTYDTYNHLDQYVFENGHYYLKNRILGKDIAFGPPGRPTNDQDEINEMLKNVEKCYISLFGSLPYEESVVLDPSSDSDDLTYLSYTDAVSLLSK